MTPHSTPCRPLRHHGYSCPQPDGPNERRSLAFGEGRDSHIYRCIKPALAGFLRHQPFFLPRSHASGSGWAQTIGQDPYRHASYDRTLVKSLKTTLPRTNPLGTRWTSMSRQTRNDVTNPVKRWRKHRCHGQLRRPLQWRDVRKPGWAKVRIAGMRGPPADTTFTILLSALRLVLARCEGLGWKGNLRPIKQ